MAILLFHSQHQETFTVAPPARVQDFTVPISIRTSLAAENWQHVSNCKHLYDLTNNDVDTTQVESSSLGLLQNVLYYYTVSKHL